MSYMSKNKMINWEMLTHDLNEMIDTLKKLALTREQALARTKLQEAGFWLAEGLKK